MGRAVEDYLKVIFELGGTRRYVGNTEIARRLGVKPSSVTEMLKKLDSMGLVDYRPWIGVKLLSRGLEMALEVSKRNRVIRIFLQRILGLEEEKASREACKLEHVISDETLGRMIELIKEAEIPEELP